jgi:hypothetical protein
MSERFSSILWGWWAADEYKDVLVFCQLCKALEFLSLGADYQMANIQDCPACETWSEMVLPIHSFLENCPQAATQNVKDALTCLWTSCNDLSEDAFRCYDIELFMNPEWERIRVEATAALQLMDWQNFKGEADRLILECRMALYPHLFRS